MRSFITKVLKKTKKLETLNLWTGGSLLEGRTYEPFSVEDVPHLHETLEKFKYQFVYCRSDRFIKTDLKVLEAFQNLKSVKIEGSILPVENNVEEMVGLLQRNQREEGQYPIFKLKLEGSIGSPVDWLSKNLETLKRTKRADKNLKVVFDLGFGLKDVLENLEGACREIQSAKTIKGLKVALSFSEDDAIMEFPAEKVKEIWKRYPGIRNTEISLSSYDQCFTLMRLDGEQEQFYVEN